MSTLLFVLVLLTGAPSAFATFVDIESSSELTQFLAAVKVPNISCPECPETAIVPVSQFDSKVNVKRGDDLGLGAIYWFNHFTHPEFPDSESHWEIEVQNIVDQTTAADAIFGPYHATLLAYDKNQKLLPTGPTALEFFNPETVGISSSNDDDYPVEIGVLRTSQLASKTKSVVIQNLIQDVYISTNPPTPRRDFGGGEFGTFYSPLQGGSFTVTFDARDLSVVPEPGSLWLVGSGLLGLVGWRRRRTRPLA